MNLSLFLSRSFLLKYFSLPLFSQRLRSLRRRIYIKKICAKSDGGPFRLQISHNKCASLTPVSSAPLNPLIYFITSRMKRRKQKTSSFLSLSPSLYFSFTQFEISFLSSSSDFFPFLQHMCSPFQSCHSTRFQFHRLRDGEYFGSDSIFPGSRRCPAVPEELQWIGKTSFDIHLKFS